MGLIDHQKADATPAQFVHNIAVLEAFGCGDHNPGTAVQFGEEFLSGVICLAAAQAYAVDSGLSESCNLVVHKSQKRVDDNRDSLAEHCRQQKAQRLPGAGRKDHKLMPHRPAVLLFQDPVNDKNLVWFQGRNPEARGSSGQDQRHIIFLHTSYNRKTAENIGNLRPIRQAFSIFSE